MLLSSSQAHKPVLGRIWVMTGERWPLSSNTSFKFTLLVTFYEDDIFAFSLRDISSYSPEAGGTVVLSNREKCTCVGELWEGPVQERDRERRNCSLPPEYDTPSTILGMPDLIPTAKNKGSPEFYLIFPALLRYPYRCCEQSVWYFLPLVHALEIGTAQCAACIWILGGESRVTSVRSTCVNLGEK